MTSRVLVAVFALVVVACSGGTDDAITTTTEAPTTTAAPAADTTTTTEPSEEEAGGTLVVAISADPGHLNPAITTSGGTHTASELLYDGLVELDDNGQPVPGLAESWDIEDDGRTYRFHLRSGVTWHDGTPFTSADVKFAFEEVILQFHSRSAASIGQALESIETPDDLTVVFTFAAPYAPLLQQLNVTEAPIVARHIYEGSDPTENPANLEPVGTGPFQFVSYAPDEEIRFAANASYFKDGPFVDELVQRIIPEAGSQVIAFEAGEVDWLWGVPGPDLARFEGDDSIGLLQTGNNPGGQNCIMTVSYNLDLPLFQNADLRRAIAHGIDRDAFLERILFGQGRVAAAPIHSGIGFAHGQGLDMPGYDPDTAAALLDAAGWVAGDDGMRAAQGVEGVDDGTPLAFRFVSFPAFSSYGELLRAQLAEIGVDVSLTALEPPVFAETVFTNRDFDTNIVSYCNGTDPEIGVRRMYISSNIQPIPFSNSSAYVNDDVDRLFDEASVTVDVDARSAVYQQIQEVLVDEMPYFWIVETLSTRAHSARCSGFTASGHFAATARCGP